MSEALVERLRKILRGTTPGPWRVIIDDDGNPLSGRPSVSASEELDCGIVHWDGFVQQYWRSARGDKEIHANAALISEAPELISEAADCIEAAERKVAELEAEVHRLANNTSRYPELMARIQSAKSEGTDSRIIALREALCELPPDFFNYQWEADEKPAFGEKFVRTVAGNNGLGMGPQWVATTPHHISGLARFIAAANPDTVGLLLAQLQAAEVGKARLSKALWEIKQSANQRALDIGTAGALLVDIDRAARAALGSGWRAIETDTPPHDVPVLLWQPPSMSHPNGLIEARPFSTGRSGKGWSEYSQHSWATHWMPLPASPSTAGER